MRLYWIIGGAFLLLIFIIYLKQQQAKTTRALQLTACSSFFFALCLNGMSEEEALYTAMRQTGANMHEATGFIDAQNSRAAQQFLASNIERKLFP